MSERSGNVAVKSLGVAVLVVGAVGIVAALILAYAVFLHPLPQIGDNLGRDGLRAGVRLGACLVMAYAGWLLSSLGTRVYGAGRRG